jgi:hypothetical protein
MPDIERKSMFTEAERQAWLTLCQELLEQYRNGTHQQVTCPICVTDGCQDCIWNILSGSDCCSYIHDVFPDSDSNALRFMKTQEWIQFRIQHLRSWIDRLEQNEIF